MARLIVKFGYMKPNKSSSSGFFEYIAKQEGVIKNLQSFAHKPSTTKQSDLINKFIKKFLDIKLHNPYQEYISRKIETTLCTYSHLYPNKQYHLADFLNQIATQHTSSSIITESNNPLMIETVKYKQSIRETINHSFLFFLFFNKICLIYVGSILF